MNTKRKDRSVFELLDELERTQGTNAKRDFLELHSKNDLLKRTFKAAFDPYIVYNVKKFAKPKAMPYPGPNEDDTSLRALLDVMLPQLESRAITGNAAKKMIETAFKLLDETQQKWYERILLKNLRVGVRDSIVEDVWPKLIPCFEVALAHTLKSDFVKGEGIKINEAIKYPVRVEPKLDGLRGIAIKKNGTTVFFTRNGKVLETVPTIKAWLDAADIDNVVLDGEMMGSDWNESASVLMSSKTKKDDSGIAFNVFDAVPLDVWEARAQSERYAVRCELVESVVDIVSKTVGLEGKSPVKVVPHIVAKNEEELRAFFSQCMNDGFEGVMIKTTDQPYSWGRSRAILKLKPVVTYEGTVVGSYEGRKGTKREGLFGGFLVLLPNNVITRVGGGFKDAVLAEIQVDTHAWMGRIVECEAQPDPLTVDGLTVDGRMRFPVFCRTRDPRDVDPSIMKAYRKFLKE